MQEYHDGSFGDIKDGAELLKELSENSLELDKTKAVHFGTEEDLRAMKVKAHGAFGGQAEYQDGTSVKDYLRRVDDKLDMIIKHFKIYPIVGE